MLKSSSVSLLPAPFQPWQPHLEVGHLFMPCHHCPAHTAACLVFPPGAPVLWVPHLMHLSLFCRHLHNNRIQRLGPHSFAGLHNLETL